MQITIVFSAVLAVAVARPGILSPIQQQYHAQDELGQYTYGYSGGPSSKVETRTADGITRGAYSYLDSNGIVQNVNYQADPVNGFRVAATNLPVGPAPVLPIAGVVAAAPAPVAVVDTPEVAAAKAQHLAIKAAADNNAQAAVIAAAPLPVVDTPEVAAEKARHLASVAVARATVVDDSALADDGSYRPHPLEEDGSYKGEPVQVALANTAAGPVAAVVSDDTSALYDDGSYKINPFEDNGEYRGEVAVVGTRLINTIAPQTIIGHPSFVGHPLSYAAAPAVRYAVAAPAYSTLGYSAVAPIHSQYHAQDELGQYTYGYSGAHSSKHETKSADGVTRGGYSYIDSNGIVQSVSYVSDAINGFRVAATNLPVGPAN